MMGQRQRPTHRRSTMMLALLLSLPAPLRAQLAADPTRIEQPEKIGVGTWPVYGQDRMIEDVDALGAHWFYSWKDGGEVVDARHVPMVWGRKDRLDRAVPVLLGFNEPDESQQAAMSVQEAIHQWPQLMASGERLSSPATSRPGTLGPRSWLGRFMTEADRRGYRVDFIAVHYYATNPDIGEFKGFLEAVHERYGRPIWVTEWALADWHHRDRFTVAQQRAFLEAGVQMMDDLPFVERHAWFGSYASLGGAHINSELVDPAGGLTAIGETFRAAAGATLMSPICDPASGAPADATSPPATC